MESITVEGEHPFRKIPKSVHLEPEWVFILGRNMQEFESFDLNREKMVPGGTTVSVWIGPLKPGKYKFFDDFNPGVIGWIVVPAPRPETAR